MNLQRLIDWLRRTAFRANAAAQPSPAPLPPDAADPEYVAIMQAYNRRREEARYQYVRGIEDATKACQQALAEQEARRRDLETNE